MIKQWGVLEDGSIYYYCDEYHCLVDIDDEGNVYEIEGTRVEH